MIVKIPRAYIEAMPANLIEGKVKLTFSLPLNAETMKLREQIAMLKILDTAVVLDITSPQGSLDDVPPPDSPRNITEDGYGEQLTSEEFAEGFEKAATMVYESGAKANEPGFVGEVMETVIDELKQKREEIRAAGSGRKGRGGTVTISHGTKSVTMTNDEFTEAANRIAPKATTRSKAASDKPRSNAARRIEKEMRALGQTAIKNARKRAR